MDVQGRTRADADREVANYEMTGLRKDLIDCMIELCGFLYVILLL